jgi:hypothetical protein
MASTDAKLVPTKNVAYRVTFPILDADGDLVTGATGLDSEVSKDGGTFTDCTNEATEIATSSGVYYLDLTSTEMNADTVAVIVKTSSTGAKTTVLTFYPQEAGDLVAAIGAGGLTADSLDATVQARLGIVAYGTAQSVTGTTIVLASASAFANDELIGAVVARDHGLRLEHRHGDGGHLDDDADGHHHVCGVRGVAGQYHRTPRRQHRAD